MLLETFTPIWSHVSKKRKNWQKKSKIWDFIIILRTLVETLSRSIGEFLCVNLLCTFRVAVWNFSKLRKIKTKSEKIKQLKFWKTTTKKKKVSRYGQVAFPKFWQKWAFMDDRWNGDSREHAHVTIALLCSAGQSRAKSLIYICLKNLWCYLKTPASARELLSHTTGFLKLLPCLVTVSYEHYGHLHHLHRVMAIDPNWWSDYRQMIEAGDQQLQPGGGKTLSVVVRVNHLAASVPRTTHRGTQH